MKYYKKWLEEYSRFQYEERASASSDDSMIEITQAEYETEIAKQWEEYNASLPVDETSAAPTYEELLAENEELERENASLLYQVLTGEELYNV